MKDCASHVLQRNFNSISALEKELNVHVRNASILADGIRLRLVQGRNVLAPAREDRPWHPCDVGKQPWQLEGGHEEGLPCQIANKEGGVV